ncbi:MAG TPA: hypothetical protein VLJ59_15985 [Mycobacteriales bacterium]|nr:hypothetical protein [Mycobacteriales bacterium]
MFGSRPVRVVLIREPGTHRGYDLALVCTDTITEAATVIERYATRWSIEVATEDARQLFGAGQARNRLAAAVRRTVPFALTAQSLTMLWHTTAGHHPNDVTAHRERAPWYTTRSQPSTADMTAKLRRVLIATRFRAAHPHPSGANMTPSRRTGWRRGIIFRSVMKSPFLT